jgi:A/G-specific adenine glycosylase
LWEFPGGKVEPGETLEECLVREIREELNLSIRVLEPLVSVKHAYTHFRITLHTFRCDDPRGRIRLSGCDDYRWITSGDLGGFAFPGADRKVIQQLKVDQFVEFSTKLKEKER